MKNEFTPVDNGAGQSNRSAKLQAVYSKKDLTRLYDVSYKTLAKWLKPIVSLIGPKHGRYYTIAQARIIFDFLGHPED